MMVPSKAARRWIPRGLGDACSDLIQGGSIANAAIPGSGSITAATNPSLVGACLCIQFPFLCSTAQYQAAQGLVNPDLIYAPIQAPVTPSAVGAGTSTTPAPYTADQAQQAINDAIAQAEVQTQAQNQQTMNETYQNLQSSSDAANTSIPTWVWIAGAGLVALMFMKK